MALLRTSDSLQADAQYTFTFEHGILNLTLNVTDIKNRLNAFMQAYSAEVLTVKRKFFSARYIVTFVPSTSSPLSLWQQVFDNAWQSIGHDDMKLVQVEGGAESSAGGGVGQLVSDTAGGLASTLGDTLTATIKPLAPYLILVVGGLLLFEYLRTKKR